jgi:Zn-dependent M28 family amino/carboxypeptidase
MAMEPYERILRLLEEDVEVELEIQVDATFHRESRLAWNTFAEIPGSTKAGEVVMAGAHLDSWHPGTGATDNAAGSVVVMEAMRILREIGVKPKRTIRAALWSGEEQGLVGSRAYVEQHFASRPEATDAEELALPRRWRRTTWPITALPEHRSVALYLNLDNGGGRVRGIYAQENLGAKAKFERWIEPLEDLGVTTVTMQNTRGTDHTSFDSVGIPGFQLVQDKRDYDSRTHHSDLDTFDRLEADELKQAAVVLASLLYQAAMDETPFPRKPIPRRPEPPHRPESPAKKPAAPSATAPPAAPPAEKPAS